MFAGHVSDEFQIDTGDGTSVALVLIEARALGAASGHPAAGRGPFALIFRGPLSPVYPQATYRFNHAQIGTFDMFIVPVGPADGGLHYEAIFT